MQVAADEADQHEVVDVRDRGVAEALGRDRHARQLERAVAQADRALVVEVVAVAVREQVGDHADLSHTARRQLLAYDRLDDLDHGTPPISRNVRKPRRRSST